MFFTLGRYSVCRQNKIAYNVGNNELLDPWMGNNL
jgi:hypothetical protein